MKWGKMQKSILYQPQTPLKPIEKPTPLRKLLKSSDLEYVAQKRLHFISVKIHGKTFYAKLQQHVPQSTTLNRDRTQQIIGFPLVVGG